LTDTVQSELIALFSIGAAQASVAPLGTGTASVGAQGRRADVVPVGSGVPSISGG
jgi:hypothetical protein